MLGLVTLAGGAVLYERFAASDIPTERAVAVVPRDDLLVLGAEPLVPFAAVVILIVFLLWLAGAAGQRWTGLNEHQWVSIAALALLAALGAFLYYYRYAPAPNHRDEAVVFGAAFLGAGACIATWWAPGDDGSFGWFAVLTACVIVGVGLTVTYEQTTERPAVRPAAVVFNDSQRGISGIIVAETSSDIYIAKVSRQFEQQLLSQQADGSSIHATAALLPSPHGRMLDIPRSRVRALGDRGKRVCATGLNQQHP